MDESTLTLEVGVLSEKELAAKLERSRRGTICTEDEGRARQEFRDATDINKILDRMTKGSMPGLDPGVPSFPDLSDLGDLRESLERVRVAGEAFAALPVRVRNAFDNDMAAFTEAFQSEDGVAKLRELGVIEPSEDDLADRREAAAEARAAKRAAAREEAKRVAAAKSPPV